MWNLSPHQTGVLPVASSTTHGGIFDDPRALQRMLREYRSPRLLRSLIELLITAVPLALFWALAWITLDAGHWWGFLFTVPAAAFLVRLFMLQHDCGHGALFHSRRANDLVGRVIGVLTLAPYDFWRHTHAHHHSTAGNLDRPHTGGINTLTVRQYQEQSSTGRLLYRLYRHPLILFGLAPSYVFILNYRLPFGFMRHGPMPWLSTMGTNLGIAIVVTTMIWLLGAGAFLRVQLPVTLLAGSIGIWLFYVQHQFSSTVHEHADDWTFHETALYGSSHYDLPAVLRWFTANIGVHHVHHLASRIPFYRLPEVLRDHPQLRGISRVTLQQSLGTVRLALWDEEHRQLVAFAPHADVTACASAPTATPSAH